MHERPSSLREQQQALTRHLRDPQRYPPPADMDAARVRIYRELIPANLVSVLSGTFPVLVCLLGRKSWNVLVERFVRDYRSHTPRFGEIARHFVAFLSVLEPAGVPAGCWRPYMAELAHYEWAEMALMQRDAEPCSSTGAVATLECAWRISPLAWPLAYTWPVHRIGPAYDPTEPPLEPTYLLVRRSADDEVRFAELSPLAWHLLSRIGDFPMLSARNLLETLGAEAQAEDLPAFVHAGAELLEWIQQEGIAAPVTPSHQLQSCPSRC
jgi:hypothetical protein